MGSVRRPPQMPTVAGEPPVEYGVVECRYKALNPTRYSFLLDRYGHTRIAAANYTTTSFIAGALGRLARHGDIAFGEFGPATGYWAYNSVISYWALPGFDPDPTPTTWKAFATENGLDADEWVLLKPCG
jgi:hypothetical protein